MEPACIADRSLKIAVIGMGYVGLPLAAAFGRMFDTVGFDVKADRIAALKNGTDATHEVTSDELHEASKLHFSCDQADLKGRDVFIVTVPTPVDAANQPDLTMLLAACETVGKAIAPGGIAIFESTVYPGCTEDDCVPVIGRVSGLKINRDFFAGYSPERINPGECDRAHKLPNVTKITSASTPDAAEFVDALYRTIVKAGTHKAPSIKVAEAAKVIENSQRDLNIAFVNELAKICRLLDIDTHDVLDAASTKWNFLKFQPGLVGGHCIGVDPYYLTHKAQMLGYLPEVILAGRRINDGMGGYVASEIVKFMIQKGIPVRNTRVLQLGITFKENCPDIRNSHAVDVVRALEKFDCAVDVYDPFAEPSDVERVYGIRHCFKSIDEVKTEDYSVFVLAVAHRSFESFPFEAVSGPDKLIYDIKGIVPRDLADARL